MQSRESLHTFDLIGAAFESDIEKVLFLHDLFRLVSQQVSHFIFIVGLIIYALAWRDYQLIQLFPISVENRTHKDDFRGVVYDRVWSHFAI